MNTKEFESRVLVEIQGVIESIVRANPVLPISARARVGAEISDYLEDEFVRATAEHPYFRNSTGAEKGDTKSRWDARTFFQLGDHREELWLDFKTTKAGSSGSNPNMGTPDKIMNWINSGGFYLTYVTLSYRALGTQLEFVKQASGEYANVYFLKDISRTVFRSSINQLQVDAKAHSEYRTRDEFISLLLEKMATSYTKQIQALQNKLGALPSKEGPLRAANALSESALLGI